MPVKDQGQRSGHGAMPSDLPHAEAGLILLLLINFVVQKCMIRIVYTLKKSITPWTVGTLNDGDAELYRVLLK